MANLKQIRKRISSVKATQKITKAMKMVAGARLNRAQQRITALRPYALKVAEMLETVSAAMAEKQADAEYHGDAEAQHPLLTKRPEKKVLFLVMSGDRGLSGAFNGNVSKMADRSAKAKQAEGIDVEFVTVGKKGREYLARRRGVIAKDFPRFLEGLDMGKAKVVSEYLVRAYTKGEVDAVYLVYNEFKSAMTQKTTMEQLLPPPPPREDRAAGAKKDAIGPTELGFEPNERAVLERLVPMYLEISIYRALLETQAGFFGAQMTAMDSATRNAKDMIARLSLVYNRARQAAITKELMEIIGGAEALKD